jgi:hypothetical protein
LKNDEMVWRFLALDRVSIGGDGLRLAGVGLHQVVAEGKSFARSPRPHGLAERNNGAAKVFGMPRNVDAHGAERVRLLVRLALLAAAEAMDLELRGLGPGIAHSGHQSKMLDFSGQTPATL